MESREFKHYTEEDLFHLEQSWGKVSIETIAKKLNRSVMGIRHKACRLGLSGMLECKDYLIASDVARILGTDRKVVSKHINERGLKARKKSLSEGKQVICIEYDNFTKWLVENPKYWNGVKADTLSLELLGVDKFFLEKKVKEDTIKMERTTLSDRDIEVIKEMYKKYYTYEDIAKKLNKEYTTIKWKIHTLIENGEIDKSCKDNRLVRRVTRENGYGWEEWQDKKLIEMFRNGYTLKEISETIGKSLSATKTRNRTLSQRMMQGVAV